MPRMIRRASMLCSLAALAALASVRGAGAAPAAPPTVRQGHSASLPRTAAWPTARPEVLGFIADDYARGVAEAKARRVPIFIE